MCETSTAPHMDTNTFAYFTTYNTKADLKSAQSRPEEHLAVG